MSGSKLLSQLGIRLCRERSAWQKSCVASLMIGMASDKACNGRRCQNLHDVNRRINADELGKTCSYAGL